MPLDEKKTSEYEIPGSAHDSMIPVRQGNGTNELWYTIPSHLQPKSTRNMSMVFTLCTPEKKSKEKHEEG